MLDVDTEEDMSLISLSSYNSDTSDVNWSLLFIFKYSSIASCEIHMAKQTSFFPIRQKQTRIMQVYFMASREKYGATFQSFLTGTSEKDPLSDSLSQNLVATSHN